MTSSEERALVYQLKLAERGLQEMVHYLRDTPFDHIIDILEELQRVNKERGVMDETMMKMFAMHMGIMKELLKLQIKLEKETEGFAEKLGKNNEYGNIKWN